jgi:hypothetical protein
LDEKMFPIGPKNAWKEPDAARLCHRKAADCQRNAMTAEDSSVRQRYFHLAKLWREMGREAERSGANTVSFEVETTTKDETGAPIYKVTAIVNGEHPVVYTLHQKTDAERFGVREQEDRDLKEIPSSSDLLQTPAQPGCFFGLYFGLQSKT